MSKKTENLEKIRTNITRFGQHVYLVEGGPNPRWAYSIGLSQDIGVEIIMAGGSVYSIDEVGNIVNDIAEKLREDTDRRQLMFDLGSFGIFSLQPVDQSWNRLIIGALDYYKTTEIKSLQIFPDPGHWTIDTPDLSKTRSLVSEPVWQWLENPWKYNIPSDSMAITNLDALKGAPITEATRWEEAEWELFSGPGPDVEKSEIRMVPLGTFLATDHSIEIVAGLKVGEGVWREPAKLEWHSWEK